MITNDKIKRIVHDLYTKSSHLEGLELSDNINVNIKAVYYFIHWLRKEKLLKEYIANYNSSFANIIYGIDSILSSSFLFRSTQQKSHFWGEKSAKWEIHILHNIRTFILLYGTKRH